MLLPGTIWWAFGLAPKGVLTLPPLSCHSCSSSVTYLGTLIIHPSLNDHATFLPAQNVHPTNDLLWGLLRFTTVTLRPCNVLQLRTSTLWCFTTVTLRPLQCFNTVTLQPCNVLLLRLFDPVMFYCYNKWTTCHRVTLWPNITLTNPWLWHFFPFWSLFLLGFLPLAWYFRHLTRFSDPWRTVALDFSV